MEKNIKEILAILNNPDVPDEYKRLALFKLFSFYGKKADRITESADYFDFSAVACGMLDHKQHKKDKEARKKFSSEIEAYKRILSDTLDLADYFHFYSSVEISILYSFLLWNGYFSVNRKHVYDSINRADIDSLFSFDVMNGAGVCLNYCDMLSDILNSAGFKAAILTNKYRALETPKKRKYYPMIERKLTLFERLKEVSSPFLPKFIGNHAITLVYDAGEFYAFDPTNLNVLEVKDKEFLMTPNKEASSIVTSPFTYIANYGLRRQSVLDDFFFREEEFTLPDYVKHFEEIMKDRSELLNLNRATLRDFSCQISDDVEDISRAVLSFKKGK